MSVEGWDRGTLVKTIFYMRIPFTRCTFSIDRIILANAQNDELEKEITLLQLKDK